MRGDKRTPLKSDSKATNRSHKRGVVGYSRKTALLEEAITQMNAGKYGRSSSALKELLALDPQNMEARRLFATLHLRLGSLIPARQAFDLLINEALQRQDYWLAESLLREYLAAGPRCVPFLEKLGLIYQEKGDVLEAVAEYGKAIDILIEDPDPDNPHLAAQLYQRIRDLAPASPVAFQLASCFDAQTGEVLARQSAPAEPTSLLSASSTDDGVFPEPVIGVMPWDVEVPPDTTVVASASLPTADLAGESVSAPNVDCAVQAEQSGESAEQPADSLIQGQTGKDVEKVQTHTTESLRLGASATPPPVQEMEQEALIVGTGSEDPQPMIPVLEPIVEISASLEESDTGQAGDRSAIDHGSRETVTHTTDPRAGVPGPAEEIPTSASDAQPDFILASSSFPSDKEPSPVSRIQVDEIAFRPELPVETNTDARFHEESSDTSTGGTSGEVLSNPTAEPWKDPGFSWESVFNRAWNFGGQHAVSASTPEAMPAKVEKPAASAGASLQAPVESASVEIPERVVESQLEEETTAELKPMPWDQIQESAIAILPAQGEESASAHTIAAVPPPDARLMITEEPAALVDVSLQAPVENASVEIPERVVESQLEGETTAELKLMPSEQTQESAIPISTVEGEESADRIMSAVVGQPVDQIETTARIETDPIQSQPLDFAIEQTEREAFSIAQPVLDPIPPTPDLDAVGVSQAAQPDRASISIEQETESSASGAPSVQEPPNLQELEGEAAQSLSMSVRDSVGVAASGEVQPTSSDSTSEPVDDPITLIPQQIVTPEAEGKSPVRSKSDGDYSDQRSREAVSPVLNPLPQADAASWKAPAEIPMALVASEAGREEQKTDDLLNEMSAGKEIGRLHVAEPLQEEWATTSQEIQFLEEPQTSNIHDASLVELGWNAPQEPPSVSVGTVGAIAESSDEGTRTEAQRRVAGTAAKTHSKPYGIRLAIAAFVSSCFSTTRSMVATCVGLLVLSAVIVALGIGVVGLTWTLLEERPSPAYQNFTTTPQRTLSDSKKNGYFLLLSLDAPAQQDPMQAAIDRKADVGEESACLGDSAGGTSGGRSSASASVVSGWFRRSDPVGQFKLHQDAIRGWVNQNESALARYSRWHTLPFEDWGYGQTATLPCAAIVFAQHVHVADGFAQAIDVGVDRLERDIEAWRIVLGQARTLPLKTLALQAMNDDIAVASSVLVQPDFDGKYLPRLTKILRPLDQSELSLRWPMQSELIAADKTFEAQVKMADTEEQTVLAMVASALPLPKQRRLNDYAEYYEASYKAAGEGRYSALPKWKDYIHVPALTMTDYLTNPIENIVGLKPLPSWELYDGLVIDTEAHLRLASLQAWLRRGPADGDLMTRLAKAGQGLYDPYTGLPMLVNMKKGVLYSVGHDGKDQDADPQSDVVVAIPVGQATAVSAKPSTASSKSR